MATVLRTPPLRVPITSPNSPPKPSYVSSRQSHSHSHSTAAPHLAHTSLRFSYLPSLRSVKFLPLASHAQIETTKEVQSRVTFEEALRSIYNWFSTMCNFDLSRLIRSFKWTTKIKTPHLKIFQVEEVALEIHTSRNLQKILKKPMVTRGIQVVKKPYTWISTFLIGENLWLISTPMAQSRDIIKTNVVYETGELFELGIQLSYLLLLLGFLGIGTFFVIRQVLVRRELDLSAKELQEQVRSGDASATELFELGAVMLRRKIYPAATKYLVQAIEKWDGDDQDLAQVYNALGVCYVRDGKLAKGITMFETAVKLQPGYVTAWNNLGDAYEQKKDFKSALNAFEEVLLFDPNNKVAQPRRDSLKEQVKLYRDVPVKTKER